MNLTWYDIEAHNKHPYTHPLNIHYVRSNLTTFLISSVTINKTKKENQAAIHHVNGQTELSTGKTAPQWF